MDRERLRTGEAGYRHGQWAKMLKLDDKHNYQREPCSRVRGAEITQVIPLGNIPKLLVVAKGRNSPLKMRKDRRLRHFPGHVPSEMLSHCHQAPKSEAHSSESTSFFSASPSG